MTIEDAAYLVTARHVFTNLVLPGSLVGIEVYNHKGWIRIEAEVLFHTNPHIDIAVLRLRTPLFENRAFAVGSTNYHLAQECFFLGFPFGLKIEDLAGDSNKGFPLPFVKKAIISMFFSDAGKVSRIFLDGHNNPGFSGGPVVVRTSEDKMEIIGVISAYLNEEKIISTPHGAFKNTENSGIIMSYAFKHVYEIVKSNSSTGYYDHGHLE